MFLAPQDKRSILFITLDSCRFDTFEAANAPNLKAVGKLHRTMAPGNFTYSSHAAMFVGFTPGIAERAEPFVNPKLTKIFKIAGAGFPGKGGEFMVLKGRSIIAGLKRKGYQCYGTGAVGWFDPGTETGEHLTRDFDAFYYSGNTHSLSKQLEWLAERLITSDGPVFTFLNVGETHVPYYFAGAPWSPDTNPCIPFAADNDAVECRRRQLACLEFTDAQLAPLLEAFGRSSVIVCADHGDCWGEDGLWEHGIHHEKVLEVPMLFRLS
jgi:membrane-anchored protein YejM (alkaline phosphatase superfamily)